jgi:hypothetical protein
MKRLAIVMLGLAACAKQGTDNSAQRLASKPPALPVVPAAQSPMPGKGAAEMKLIPIPKDKAQLTRLLAMGYTVHQNHMHPPGVKSCPFDKNAGSVID